MTDISQLIIYKLAEKNLASLSDQEIERCLSGCCSPTKLIKTAKLMRESGRLNMDCIAID